MTENLISDLINDELDSISSEVAAGRRTHILKSLDERGTAQALIRAQYSGRYPFELLQNANDALSGNGSAARRVRFQLTETALLVADTGAGFGDDEVRAICGLGRSSKDPRKSIGYKGLGFKSVGEITQTPQVLSNRYRFMFDAARATDTVRDHAGIIGDSQRIPVYAFPFAVHKEELGADTARVEELFEGGFSTVVRLPFTDGVTPEMVDRHLSATLHPRLLLFLHATETLEVEGLNARFEATAIREEADSHSRVLVETDTELEEWLVFTDRRPIPEPDLTTGLGDEWKLVEEVGVSAAIRIENGRVASDRIEPLHVYFPTEEVHGLSLVLSADFALELDRRHVARSPESTPYNTWLRDELAAFLARSVAPKMAELYPEASTLAAFAPKVEPIGFGKDFIEAYELAMATSRFVVAENGQILLPGEIQLLPSSTPPEHRTRRYVALSKLPPVLVLEASGDPHIRRFLSRRLECRELDLDDTVAVLEPPDEALDAFAEWLVSWSDTGPRRALADALSDVKCVKTTDGAWVSPNHGVFFPRERDAPDLPETLTVPIAVLPDNDAYRDLLEQAGVRPFRWREVIFDRLLPILTQADAEDSDRLAALQALRSYLDVNPRGDREVESRVGAVLLRAQQANGEEARWKPAREVYFSSDWLGSNALEQVFGPFRQSEFLAASPPDGSDARKSEHEFLEWLGVSPIPRLDHSAADRRDIYMWHDRKRHPHRRAGDWWDRWRATETVQHIAQCPQGHPASQQLRESHWLDRFGDIAASADARRMTALFQLLAENWGLQYSQSLNATFYCQHMEHVGERERKTKSVLGFALSEANWVPAEISSRTELHKPAQTWRHAPEVPARVLAVLPVLPEVLDTDAGATLAQALGVVDAARPRISDLTALLERLASDHREIESPDHGQQILLAARWVMRALDDAIGREGVSARELKGIPLLASFEGVPGFYADPYASDDPLLSETWRDDVAILDADRGLSRLVMAAGLRSLEDEVAVTPRPIGGTPELGDPVLKRVSNALPYIAAMAVSAVPSRRDTIIPRLIRLELVICERLELDLSLNGMMRTRSDATSYVAVAIRRQGRARAFFGTAHVESGTDGPNWFALGPQLAEFLEVPLGDAFALILSSDNRARISFLRSRGLAELDVDEAASDLGQPLQPIPDTLSDFRSSTTEDPQEDDRRDTDDSDESEAPGESVDGPSKEDSDEPEARDEIAYPDIDFGSVVGGLAEVDDFQTRRDTDASRGNRSDRTGSKTGIAWDTQARTSRLIGRRGEEVAFHYERDRLISLRYQPSAVDWVSQRNETSPFDIRSLDDDGQVIFIEVKATVARLASEPFEISAGELEFAARKGGRYWIYRVIETGSATPRIIRFRDPLTLLSQGNASIRQSGARMAFHVSAPPRETLQLKA